MSANDYTPGWQAEGDELVSRLSRLEWAPVPDELRERCWKEFEHRIARNGEAGEKLARSRPAFNVGERYEMRRFAPLGRTLANEPARRSLVSSARLAAAQVGRRHHMPRRALSLS